MNETKKSVVLLSASPKTDQDWAVSALLSKRGLSALDDGQLDVRLIPVRHALLHRETKSAFEAVQKADAIVVIFPLYIFCMPAMLTRFLQDFAAEYPLAERSKHVYAIINCGFPEPEINSEAMRVLESFSVQTGRIFLGGVMVGCGGMTVGAQGAPFMRPIFDRIDQLFARVRQDLLSGEPEPPQTIAITVKFPRALYFLAGNAGWISMARKNHIKRRELYRTPYQE